MDYYQRSATFDLVICPYDKTHVIRKERLSRHLIKCAKNNKTVLKTFTSCEYNHTHKIKRGDGSKHYEHCEEKRWYNGWLERDNICKKKGDTSFPKYSEIQIEGENWNDELEPFCNEKYCGAIPELKKHY